MTSKQALERLSTVASIYCDECAINEEDLDKGMFEKDYQAVKTIQKDLEILEILKQKIDWLAVIERNGNFYLHLGKYINISLTETEFNLIKEWLEK